MLVVNVIIVIIGLVALGLIISLFKDSKKGVNPPKRYDDQVIEFICGKTMLVDRGCK